MEDLQSKQEIVWENLNKKLEQKAEDLLPAAKELVKRYNFPELKPGLRDYITSCLFLNLLDNKEFLKIRQLKQDIRKGKIELIQMAIQLRNIMDEWNDKSSISAKDQFGTEFKISNKTTADFLFAIVQDFIKSTYKDHHILKDKTIKGEPLNDEQLESLMSWELEIDYHNLYYNNKRANIGHLIDEFISEFENIGAFNSEKNKEKTGIATGQNTEYAFLYDLLKLTEVISKHRPPKVDNIDKRDVIKSYLKSFYTYQENLDGDIEPDEENEEVPDIQ
jgi:hypothetical protein